MGFVQSAHEWSWGNSLVRVRRLARGRPVGSMLSRAEEHDMDRRVTFAGRPAAHSGACGSSTSA
jgi:hypothetical protein